jgi:radical SAM protein with 4Fe4S-binding SPASM domain
MKFLTDNKFDSDKILKVISESDRKNLKEEDIKFLEQILDNFHQGDFSMLNTQELKFLEKNEEEIWTPYLIHRYKFNFFENNKELPDFPIYLILEPTSICNLRCPFCHQAEESFTKNKDMLGMMDLELFKKIIDEAHAEGTKAITLTCRGEPTLHPDINEILMYCKGKFLEFKMNTNATKMKDEFIHTVLQCGITDMVFSVDSFLKEQYESLRVGGVFEEILENIKKFKEIREKEYPDSKCVTRISGVQVSDEQDPKKFKEFWEQYVDFVVMVRMLNRWDIYNNSTDEMAQKPCHYLGRSLSIYYDGSVIPCDMDFKGELSLGSIKDSTIREVWHNKIYKNLFETHRDNRRSEIFPCDRCPA